MSDSADTTHTTTVGLLLAGAIIGVWVTVHVSGVFLLSFEDSWVIFLAPCLIALQCWLSVGLFIVAHDCMHGSLAPGRPGLNRAIGTLSLALYAGFSFKKLNTKHHEHHATPGLEGDPDYYAPNPRSMWRWYTNFMVVYFSWREFFSLAAIYWFYILVLNVDTVNMLVFWALPAILSSFQLFFFGTFLPHRPGARPFRDEHRARSNEYNVLMSLLTCFHFGYHHEHHVYPHLPWWRLPGARTRS